MKTFIENLIKKTCHAELDSASQVAPSSDTSCHLLPPMGRRQFSFAFTLAEVLITLGIIGVVAALTIPSLVNNYREWVTVVRLNKTISMLSQGFTKMANDNDCKLTNYYSGYNDLRHLNIDFYKQYFKITEACTFFGSKENCVPIVYNLTKDKTTSEGCGTYDFIFTLENGVIFCMATSTTWYGQFALQVDINGKKGPNALGYDVFRFFIKDNGAIVPRGTIDSNFCMITDKGANSRNGGSCSEWIMKFGNMDYLHKYEPFSGWR